MIDQVPEEALGFSHENEDLRTHNDFLKTLVSRLEVELRAFQTKYPSAVLDDAEVDEIEAEDATAPWTINGRYLSPLLVAYDERLKECRQENAENRKQLKTIDDHSRQLEARNDELQNELEHKMESLLRRFESIDGGQAMPSEGILRGNEEARELYTRVEVLSEQNGILREQQKELEKQLHDARVSLTEQAHLAHELDQARAKNEALETDRSEMSEQVRAVTEKLSSIESLREKTFSDLESTTLELKRCSDQLVAARHASADERLKAQGEIAALKKEIATLTSKDRECLSRRDALERAISSAADEKKILNHEIDSLKRDLESLTKSMRNAEASADEALKRQDEAAKEVVKARAECAECVLERDQVAQREARALRMLEDLKKRSQDDLVEARKAIQREFAEELDTWRRKATTLSTDLRATSITCTELESTNELLKRSCASLESKLKRLTATIDAEQLRDRVAVDVSCASLESKLKRLTATVDAEQRELHDRVAVAVSHLAEVESQRDAAESKSDRATLELKKLRDDWEREKKVREIQMGELRKLQDEKDLQVVETHDVARGLEVQLAHARAELESARRKAKESQHELEERLRSVGAQKSKEVFALEAQLKESELLRCESEQRAADLLEGQDAVVAKWKDETRSSALQFQRLLRDAKEESERLSGRKQLHSFKWKDETRSSALQFQRLLRDAKEESERLSVRNSQLDARIVAVVRERDDARNQLLRIGNSSKERDAAVSELKRRANEAQAKLHTAEAEKQSLIHENRQLQNSLDRHEIEVHKLKRQHANLTRREKALREQHEMFSRSSPAQYHLNTGGGGGGESTSGLLLSTGFSGGSPRLKTLATGAKLFSHDEPPTKDFSVTKPARTENEKMSRA